MSGIVYRPAPDLGRMAEPIIRQHHTHLLDLPHDVTFVWRSKATKTRGKEVLGKARKVTGLNAALLAMAEAPEKGFSEHADHDRFVIEIAEDTWDTLDQAQRRALIDHELAHLTIDFDEDTGAISLALRAHDVEEFAEIFERHGPWEPGLERLVHVQQSLFDRPAGRSVGDVLVDRAEAGDLDHLAPEGSSVTVEHDGRSVTIGNEADDAPPPAA